MELIKEARGDVEKGLNNALEELYAVIREDRRYLNFFLSDGENIWAFRKGTSLYYLFDDKLAYTAVTSTVPDDQYNWVEFPQNTLAKLEKGRQITFYEPIVIEREESEKRVIDAQSGEVITTDTSLQPTAMDQMIELYETRDKAK